MVTTTMASDAHSKWAGGSITIIMAIMNLYLSAIATTVSVLLQHRLQNGTELTTLVKFEL